MKCDVAIIGAGPAGLTAGYELVKNGKSVIVLEQDAEKVGGISRTVDYKGFKFDIGGHRFFSKSNEVEDLWTELLGKDMLVRNRLSRIYYNGKFYNYPLKPINAFMNLGFMNTLWCVMDYGRSKLFPRKHERSLEDWVINHFGKRLYRIFFKTYTEKVWGIPCDQISADWAAQRIKGLSLWRAIFHAFKPQNSSNKEAAIKTLIDQFRYPKFGPGMMWEEAARRIQSVEDSEVRLNEKVDRIQHSSGKVLAVQTSNANGTRHHQEADHFISTMPLRSLVRALDPSPPKAVFEAGEALNYRDFITVALIIDHPHSFPDNWIYIHDPAVKVGRIQNFKNWSPHMVPNDLQTCLGLEYFCFEGDGLWQMTDEELIDLGSRELKAIGILNNASVVDGTVVRVPKAYPVYDDGYKMHIQTILDYLREELANLQVIGRNGMHRYNNQDHAMMTGLLAARNILGQHYDLWSVNEDAEYLEEIGKDRMVPRKLNEGLV